VVARCLIESAYCRGKAVGRLGCAETHRPALILPKIGDSGGRGKALRFLIGGERTRFQPAFLFEPGRDGFESILAPAESQDQTNRIVRPISPGMPVLKRWGTEFTNRAGRCSVFPFSVPRRTLLGGGASRVGLAPGASAPPRPDPAGRKGRRGQSPPGKKPGGQQCGQAPGCGDGCDGKSVAPHTPRLEESEFEPLVPLRGRQSAAAILLWSRS